MPAGEEGVDRTVVVPEAFFTALVARLIKDFGPHPAEQILYDIGRDAGRAFAMAGKRVLGPLASSQDIEAFLLIFGKEYGWADIAIKTLDVPGKYAVIEWRNGVAVPKGGSRRPVCHLGRGLLSGAAEVIFGQKCDALETQCEATGADHCEIVVGVPDRVAELAETLA